MKKFVGVTVNQYDENDKGTPVLVFNAKSIEDPPESIEPYDDSIRSKELAEQWSSFIQGAGKDHTVGQLAMSLGGLQEDE